MHYGTGQPHQYCFSESDITSTDQAIQTIETILNGKTINLTVEQRQQYGRIAEQNKL